jgi:hypothetical protein
MREFRLKVTCALCLLVLLGAPVSGQDPERGKWTLVPQVESWTSRTYYSPKDDDKLGEMREPEVFETEHHVYTSPFRYRNVKVDAWVEIGKGKGIEMLADRGTITIEEDKPIISVTVVGSGCSGNNYNIVEWWGPGEKLTDPTTRAPQLIKRQRIGNLQGQHDAFIQRALSFGKPQFKTIEEANAYIKNMQDKIYKMTSGFYMPGSLMTGLYENTAYFRIGDTSRPEHTAYKIVISGGGLDYEDPGDNIARYPAEYTFRLIDVLVKKTAAR